jgi:hypothetical protein
MARARRWTVEIYIDEHEDERRTRAEARLINQDRLGVAGVGVARRNPVDPEVPEIGDELAVSRALSDLAHQLLDATAGDIEQLARDRARLRG